MTHLDLFSGIGGFALAARWAGFETVQFVEIEPYAQKVLAKNFPDVPIHDDIKTFSADEFYGVGLLTGGYPCQPFSQAGKRRGKEDDRHLWPEMFRIIKECRPTWICCENVVGHIKLGLDEVLTDLENEGYSCQSFVIPACAKDAPHRRDRLWIVANSLGQRPQGRLQRGEDQKWEGELGHSGCGSPVHRQQDEGFWPVEPRICRVVDGIPNRTHRIKGLGNAIVPQVAYEIMRLMK
jgi:DNA (cytosine-5)-methyltransferase 1